MTPKEATGETPFSLVFGTEDVIPTEVELPSYRIKNYVEQENNVALLIEMLSSNNPISGPEAPGRKVL